MATSEPPSPPPTAISACAADSRKAARVFSTAPTSNGFYETWPIPYGEKAFGFAKTGQTMVNVPTARSSGST
jgi:hypothetical protein